MCILFIIIKLHCIINILSTHCYLDILQLATVKAVVRDYGSHVLWYISQCHCMVTVKLWMVKFHMWDSLRNACLCDVACLYMLYCTYLLLSVRICFMDGFCQALFVSNKCKVMEYQNLCAYFYVLLKNIRESSH